MIYEITIQADTNDGDCVTSVNDISEENLNKLRPLIEAIKNFKPYSSGNYCGKHQSNYPVGECFREDLGEKPPEEIYDEFAKEVFDIFEDLLPEYEWGIHTIEKVEVCPKQKKEKLL